MPTLKNAAGADGWSFCCRIESRYTIFVRYGRVAVEDEIAELVGAKVVCIFVGERPGLGTAESMSAYLAYNAKIGMPEARRTVVSNIHKDGITAVEAGANLTDLIQKILIRRPAALSYRIRQGEYI